MYGYGSCVIEALFFVPYNIHKICNCRYFMLRKARYINHTLSL